MLKYEKIKNQGDTVFKNAIETVYDSISKRDYAKQDACSIKCKSKRSEWG